MKGTSSINNPITLESLNKLIEQIEKDKVTVTATYLMRENEIVVVNHEKMREENYFTGKRGKEILCNPKHEELIRKELHI